MVLDLNPTKGNSNRKAIHLRGRGGRKPIVIKWYPFKEGRTLRFVDCYHHTTTGSKGNKTVRKYRECHVHLPPDEWRAGFSHGVMTGAERRASVPHKPQQAEYNAGVFPRFMDALERTVGVENIKRCKKVGDEVMGKDADEEDSDEDAGQVEKEEVDLLGDMENPERDSIEIKKAEQETIESDNTKPETTHDANTEGPEEGAKDEYWIHDEIAGLYITMNPANVHGRTTVIRHADTGDFLVLDSSWDYTRPLADYTTHLVRNAAHIALGVATNAELLGQPISVYHAPVKGTPSIMRSEPYSSTRVKFIQEYAKAHDPARVTEYDLKRPVPATGAGDNVNAGVTGDAASGITDIAAPSLNDPSFLYVCERNSGWVTLTLDLQDLAAPKMQLDKNRPVDLLRGKDGAKPFHIDYYAFKYGYTLRLNNCGYTTQFKGHPIEGKLRGGKSTKSSRATIPWKEFHMHLPDNRWHAPCKHEMWGGEFNGRAQGTHNEEYARHNVVVFPRFMDKLEEIIGEGRIRMCKNRGNELVDIDAGDGEKIDEEGEENDGDDSSREVGMEGGDGESE
ncbi:hypothetical protein BKA58DRAFT_398541 [Alternaria rosae]|uniref:uncharacterized protein n=1 Tax=Alternaria rosae TaxID=1187941 RepID=UPI001E8E40A9|nr:uncharacterized protein BKA58DRAFT_398541 [Alternaria rosae]KAH6878496.1 hypothetical protein BKA58DRAFT_398541 [Alternaria rosae]